MWLGRGKGVNGFGLKTQKLRHVYEHTTGDHSGDNNNANIQMNALYFLSLDLSQSVLRLPLIHSASKSFCRYLYLSNCYFLSTGLLDWRAVQSSQIFRWFACLLTRQPGPASHHSALHIRMSVLTWSTTYAQYTAVPPSLWSQRPEDWALLTVRFSPLSGSDAPPQKCQWAVELKPCWYIWIELVL